MKTGITILGIILCLAAFGCDEDDVATTETPSEVITPNVYAMALPSALMAEGAGMDYTIIETVLPYGTTVFTRVVIDDQLYWLDTDGLHPYVVDLNDESGFAEITELSLGDLKRLAAGEVDAGVE